MLYVVCCACPPTLSADEVLRKARVRGWDVCLVCTPTAARWLRADLPRLAELTGHPVRSEYKLPGEPDVLPPADAMLVAPATSNTVNKWALGISDTLALGLITEATGGGLPIVTIPCLNHAQAAHPAFARSVELLRACGVSVLVGDVAGMWAVRAAGSGQVGVPAWDVGLDELDRLRQARSGRAGP